MSKDQTATSPSGSNPGEAAPRQTTGGAGPSKRPKHRLPAGVRIPLKVLGWLLLVVILLPVLLYIPPIQTGVKNLATRIVREKTGMDIEIDRFRLKFPLDVSLQGVRVIEASGDT
ncbi:MAG: hypothetical protein K2L35_04740, partial [Muribaculaceae bacterium]|nr:hypothetical protein [Muribaculaceae bacterium]